MICWCRGASDLGQRDLRRGMVGRLLTHNAPAGAAWLPEAESDVQTTVRARG